MVTNNKVLTVSYGTFSCTLEGFDESFDTMKAIAEYFRDLAADDRYFGAEPPTPDAEMLSRIAEREIERRVETRLESGSIVLSAAPAAAEVAAPAEAPVQEDVAEIEAPIEAEAPVAEPEVIAEEVVAPMAEPVVEEAPVVEAAIEDDYDDEEEDTDNLFGDAYDSLSAADDTLEVAEPVQNDVEDSIAAKLRRIRAVVSRVETQDNDEDDFIEDQHADDMMMEATQEVEEEITEVTAEAIDDSFDTGSFEDSLAVEIDEDDFDDADVEIDEPVAVAPKPRARVIRMKRTEFEDAIADGLLEEDDAPEAVEDAPVAKAAPVNTPTDDVEADLMAALADVEPEMEPAASPIPEEAKPVKPVRPRRARRAALEEQVPEEAAMDRLIDEANTKLDEPEGNRRRSAIAHLRAAVAATKAEKDAGASMEKPDQSGAYRDDLADAVRPGRTDGDRKDRGATPLKLVAAQRIDGPAEDDQSAVRPRRVSVEDVTAVEANEGASDFVEFAENMGATQLPDVLEAAASYLTFVEGRNRFSRPMLMRLAYQVGDERFEREAGLRSFGQLLRDKKIEKIAGGRFTVSESINFKPGDRAAG